MLNVELDVSVGPLLCPFPPAEDAPLAGELDVRELSPPTPFAQRTFGDTDLRCRVLDQLEAKLSGYYVICCSLSRLSGVNYTP